MQFFAFIPRIGHSKNIASALLHYCGSQYYKSLTWNVVVISAFFDCLRFDEISPQKKYLEKTTKKFIFKCTFYATFCLVSFIVSWYRHSSTNLRFFYCHKFKREDDLLLQLLFLCLDTSHCYFTRLNLKKMGSL